jgi:hypothetical protein
MITDDYRCLNIALPQNLAVSDLQECKAASTKNMCVSLCSDFHFNFITKQAGSGTKGSFYPNWDE